MQRLERAPGVAELGVVVVLDDDGVPLARPVEQPRTAGERHAHAERELVRRRDVDQPRVVRDRLDDEPFVVDRYAGDARPVRAQQHGGRRVARVLDDGAVARPQHHPGDQVDGLLYAVGHDELLRHRLHGAAG